MLKIDAYHRNLLLHRYFINNNIASTNTAIRHIKKVIEVLPLHLRPGVLVDLEKSHPGNGYNKI